MKKKTLRQRIINYLQKQGTFVASGEIQRLAMNAGYTAQNAGRRCREAVEDGILEVEYREKNHAYYKYVPKVKTVTDYKVVGNKAVAIKRVVRV